MLDRVPYINNNLIRQESFNAWWPQSCQLIECGAGSGHDEVLQLLLWSTFGDSELITKENYK